MSASLLQRHTAQSLRAELETETASSFSQPAISKPRTITFAELPEWMKDNESILTGYRGELNSWRKCLGSVFGYLHNETAFLSSAVFCLFCSAFFHMASSHSKQVAARCHALDYSGIIVLILGSHYPCLYYGFYCESHYKIGYLLLITVVGLVAACVVLNPTYAKPTHRHARTKVFIALGLSGILPITHLVLSHGISTPFREMGFGWLLAAGVMYITGAVLYANRVPERLAPGKFDLFFSSHQIFHSRSGMCVT
ncbi:hemolysin-III related-domain-containing protein [Russula brevipes]|nr:hemolysin-III related-domain-containing protein [Russula brevipes]